MEKQLIPAAQLPHIVEGTTPQTWATLRYKGTGPRFIKIAGRIYYRADDLAEWLDANTRTQSSRGTSRAFTGDKSPRD